MHAPTGNGLYNISGAAAATSGVSDRAAAASGHPPEIEGSTFVSKLKFR